MGEGTVFSLFVSPHIDGEYHVQGLDRGTRGTPVPGQDWMGYPPPWPGLDGVPPHLDLGWGTPNQDWMGYPPGQDWMGYLPPGPGMGYPQLGLDGVPPGQDWMGYPPPP